MVQIMVNARRMDISRASAPRASREARISFSKRSHPTITPSSPNLPRWWANDIIAKTGNAKRSADAPILPFLFTHRFDVTSSCVHPVSVPRILEIDSRLFSCRIPTPSLSALLSLFPDFRTKEKGRRWDGRMRGSIMCVWKFWNDINNNLEGLREELQVGLTTR